MLLRENVLDLSHFPFLHETSFAQNDWVIVPEVETTENTVLYRASFQNSPFTAVFSRPMGISPTKPVNRTQTGELLTPAIHFSTWSINDPAPEPGRRSDFLMRAAHITTPISPDQTHYFWSASFDVPNVDPVLMEEARAGVTNAFSEDIWMLNLIQKHVRDDPRGLNFPEAVLGADKAGIHARRILNGYLSKERGGA
jgi:vanillate O-demethylase monooxygenase subunit